MLVELIEPAVVSISANEVDVLGWAVVVVLEIVVSSPKLVDVGILVKFNSLLSVDVVGSDVT